MTGRRRQPATQETLAVWEAAREMGLLVGKGAIDGNVLRIQPPLCVSAADVDFALEVLDEAPRRAEGGASAFSWKSRCPVGPAPEAPDWAAFLGPLS